MDDVECKHCKAVGRDTGRWLMCAKCGRTELKPGARRVIGQVTPIDGGYLIREWVLPAKVEDGHG